MNEVTPYVMVKGDGCDPKFYLNMIVSMLGLLLLWMGFLSCAVCAMCVKRATIEMEQKETVAHATEIERKETVDHATETSERTEIVDNTTVAEQTELTLVWMTGRGQRFHTCRDCRAFRAATTPIVRYELCHYCKSGG